MNEQNLKPIKHLSTEEAKQRGSKGGKASVKARRERKLMSQIYAEFLAKKHKTGTGDISGDELLEKVITKVLARGDSSSVAMIKEIREGTEGNKVDITNNSAPVIIQVVGVDADTDPEKTPADN